MASCQILSIRSVSSIFSPIWSLHFPDHPTQPIPWETPLLCTSPFSFSYLMILTVKLARPLLYYTQPHLSIPDFWFDFILSAMFPLKHSSTYSLLLSLRLKPLNAKKLFSQHFFTFIRLLPKSILLQNLITAILFISLYLFPLLHFGDHWSKSNPRDTPSISDCQNWSTNIVFMA